MGAVLCWPVRIERASDRASVRAACAYTELLAEFGDRLVAGGFAGGAQDLPCDLLRRVTGTFGCSSARAPPIEGPVLPMFGGS
ncbi:MULTISPECIES: hypothetical protein [Streptomyces]|uniref:hypothetical protein n=1 Tax=Streptomyces TaxID=1883 RepID=UPI0014884504|nr:MULTISPECIES: hypothetical protein [Streptomyces]